MPTYLDDGRFLVLRHEHSCKCWRPDLSLNLFSDNFFRLFPSVKPNASSRVRIADNAQLCYIFPWTWDDNKIA